MTQGSSCRTVFGQFLVKVLWKGTLEPPLCIVGGGGGG